MKRFASTHRLPLTLFMTVGAVIGGIVVIFQAIGDIPSSIRVASNYSGFVSPLGASAGFAMPACGGSDPGSISPEPPAGSINNTVNHDELGSTPAGATRNSKGESVYQAPSGEWRSFSVESKESGPSGGTNSNNDPTSPTQPPLPPPPPGTRMPTAILEVRTVTTGSSWTRNDITIREGQEIALRWRSHNAQVCTAENFETADATSGETQQVEEPSLLEQRAYTLRCENSGRVAADQIVVRTLPTPPTAHLEVRNTTRDTSWTREKIIIGEGEDIALRWSSERAVSCSGTHFTTGGAGNGIDETVEEPAVGTERTYLLRCTNEGGSDNDEVRVTKPFHAPDLFTSHRIIRLDGVATLTWDLKGNDPAACTLEGPGVSRTTLVGISEQRVQITGQSVFTLDCPGGVSSVRIRTVGQTFES